MGGVVVFHEGSDCRLVDIDSEVLLFAGYVSCKVGLGALKMWYLRLSGRALPPSGNSSGVPRGK